MYAIYREDCESHQINVMSIYQNYVEANFQLNQTVTNYLETIRADKDQVVKFVELEGATKLERTLVSSEYETGFYLKRSTIYPNRIHVFKKARKLVPGYIWGSGETFEIKEIMWFGILELKTQTSLTHHDFETSNKKEISQTFKQHGGQVRLIEELKEALERRLSLENQSTYLRVDEIGNLTQLFNSKRPDGNEFTMALNSYIRREMPHLLENDGDDD